VWAAAAVLTTLIGIAAVESLGDGILGSPEKPLTRGDVASQLAASPDHSGGTPSAAPSASSSPSASRPPSVSPPGKRTPPATSNRVFTIDGGTVVASCDGNLVTLLSWSPAQGYHVMRVERGPAKTAEIRFGNGKENEGHGSRLTVSCRDGRPQGSTED
jgi:serine/threonine-protein kinase